MASRASKDLLPTSHSVPEKACSSFLGSFFSASGALCPAPAVHGSDGKAAWKATGLLGRSKTIAPLLPYVVASLLILATWIPVGTAVKLKFHEGLLGSLPVNKEKPLEAVAAAGETPSDGRLGAVDLGLGWLKNEEVTAGAVLGSQEGVAAVLNPGSFAGIAPRTVTLPLGKVLGTPCTKFPAVTEFLGIPYAEPMLGERRFTRPALYSSQYPSPYLDATEEAPPCGSICEHMGARETDKSSEDCLHLNVWVPPNAIPGQSKLPVRVYIHGGAVTDCSASDPNIRGCDFVYKTGIIQVNIQFRLGVFGYLAHPTTFQESNTTGNWGLLDQQLALQWVQKNIASFGGDPARVLLNGNSAGGQRVDFHMVLPGSAGLFAAAISQSPPCSHFIGLDTAYEVSVDFLARVNCSQPMDPAAELACLRALPWDLLQTVSTEAGVERPREIVMCDEILWKPYFHYVLDGTVVPRPVLEAFTTGAYNQVPYMVGTTTADGRDFIEMFYVSEGVNITTDTAKELLMEVYPGADPAPILEAYPEDHYLGKLLPDKARLTSIWTDIFFTCPVYRRLTAMSVGGAAPTYAYSWNAIPTCPVGDSYYGPTHASELMFVGGITTGIFPPFGTCNFNEREVALSNIMTGAWAGMAAGQAPVWPDGTSWTRWDPVGHYGTFLDTSRQDTAQFDALPRCNLHQAAVQASLKWLASPKGTLVV